MTIGLTPHQRRLLAYLRETETCPSFDEMARALDTDKSNIHRLLTCLEERGYIRRLRRRVRVIEVVAKPVVIDGEAYRFIPKTRAACLTPEGEAA